MKNAPYCFLLLLALLAPGLASNTALGDDRPNVVLILTDNHGAWTLGCYGNEDIRTPNLDRMADEGTLFENAFAVNPVCSPTRASILTGLMPSQHGVMTPTDGNFMMGKDAYNLLEEFTSLPEIFKANGYDCGLSGKWHLGDNLHPQEGLDDLWVTMPIGSTSTFYGARILENGKERIEPQYMTDLWTDRAVEFIGKHSKQNKSDNEKPAKPFFLYLAYNGPYGLSPLLLEPARNRHAEFYADHPLPSFPRVPTRPWQFSNRDYVNNLDAFRRYAAEVSGVDDGVGRVMAALKESGIDDNTLVIFTGDQGLGCGQHNLWGMGDHTRPLHGFDATLQVPMIVRQPKKVAAKQRVTQQVSQVDLMPTVLELAGLSDHLPKENPLPGKDLSPLLRGEVNPDTKTDRAVFLDYENLRAIRTDEWKLLERMDDDGKLSELDSYDELYDLKNDPGETVNLYDDPAHKETREHLKARLNRFFAEHNLPKHDMWNGGDSQTHNTVIGDYAQARYERLKRERGLPDNVFDPGFNPPPMDIPDGYVVETAAAPPLVNHPVAVCLDDRGRLFVCENTGDNLKADELSERLQNQITVLTDTNNDGRYDKRQVFADGFTFPQGVLWHDDALYVASPPSIWKLVDTDNDGVADERSEIASGFGFTGNAASVHTPRVAPNGRLFWGHGRKKSQIKNIAGEIIHEGETARVYTSLPDGSELRSFCGGGMANPVELDFWKTGEVIGNVNILKRNPARSDCLVHWQHGGVYPRYTDAKGLAEFTSTGPLLEDIYDFGHVAVSGMTRYRSGTLAPDGENWTDQFFMTLFNTQEVVRLQIERDGSTFTNAMHPFLKINDPDVHLVSIIEDADGSLLLTDTGGWFREGCPSSGFAKPDVAGAVYRIRKAGPRDYRTDWHGKRIDWKKASPEYLTSLLDDTRHVVRRRAADALAKLGDKAVAALSETLADYPDADVRIRAAFALGRTGSTKAGAPLRAALKDKDAEVRIAVTNSIGQTRDKSSIRQMLPNLHHASTALQRETAMTLGLIGDPTPIPQLLTALSGHDLDRPREHALIRALLDIGDLEATRAALADIENLYGNRADFQRRILIVLDRLDADALSSDALVPLLSASDDALRTTALEILLRQPDSISTYAGVLKRQLKTPERARIDVINALLERGLKENDEGTRSVVGAYLGHDESKLRSVAMSAIAGSSPFEAPADWLAPMKKHLASKNDTVTAAALAAAATFSPQPFEAEARAIATDESRSKLLRVQALQLYDASGKSFGAEAFELLTSIIDDPETGAGERLQATQLLTGGTGLTKPQIMRAAELMAKAGPLEFPLFIQRVRPRRNDLELGKLLTHAYLNAPGASSVDAQELKRLMVAYYPAEFWQEPVKQLEQRLEAERNITRTITELEAKIANGAGDAKRGKEIALSAQATCVACHHIGETGNFVGPDLSHIGKIRKPADLIESILLPSASLAQDYEAVSVATSDGMIQVGVLRSETPDSIDLALPTGESKTINREQITSVDPIPVSLMPQGLDQVLGEQALLDLVAYLTTLK